MKSAKPQDMFGRWGFGDYFAPVPPPGCGDYAFLLHIVSSLKTQGHAACILPHGVLFRSGAEAEIRKFLVKKHYISGIIGLPGNLFYGTGIPACIIIIDKEHAAGAKGIFMIDAKDGYQKDGAKNRLREQDLKLIVDTWEAHEDIPHYAKFVTFSEIEDNDYNLNIPRYVVPEDKDIQQDIYAHLHGGLPTHDVEDVLTSLWEACPTLKDNIFKKESNGYYSLLPSVNKIGETVNADSSYQEQNELYRQVIEKWCETTSADMHESVKEECEPKSLIAKWSENLLSEAKKELKLVAPYNVYEILMNYWAEIMQDDCYMVSRDGWKVNLVETKKKSTFEDLECDLLPVSVVVDEYFNEEYAAIKAKRVELEQINAELDSIPEENPDAFDEGIYEVLEKVNEANVKKLVAGYKKKTIEADVDTVKVWDKYLELCEKKKAATKVVSSLVADLTSKVKDKYEGLSPDDIRILVVENKWITEIKNRSNAEIKRVTESISNEITALYNRYANTLPEIESKISKLSTTVGEYLKSMGIE